MPAAVAAINFAVGADATYDHLAVIRAALVIPFVVGCASPMTALRDDNRHLTAQVTELRGERHSQDRKVRDLQRQLDLLRAKLVTSVMDTPMPALPVEVVMPPGGAVSTTDPTGARIVAVTENGDEIVYEGDAAAGRAAILDDDEPGPVAAPPRVVVAQRTSAVTAARRAPTVDRSPERSAERAISDAVPDRNGDAGAEYRAAVDLVKAGNTAAAVPALRAFISSHAHHDYADNAQYWLGEAFYAARDFQQALAEFRTVIEVYPRGNKVPDALLKVGFCYQSMGSSAKARAVLEQVVNLYPKSEPAALAARRLEQP